LGDGEEEHERETAKLYSTRPGTAALRLFPFCS
jgi:hypothetical protein